MWCEGLKDKAYISFCDNDGVRFSLIRGTATGDAAQKLLKLNLECKNVCNSTIWFARVPTEANLSDLPSRGVSHPLLEPSLDISGLAWSFISSHLFPMS